MTEEKKNGNGNGKVSIHIMIMLGSTVAGIAGVWGTLSADNARIQTRVEVLERRVETDKNQAAQELKELKSDVKETNSNVQLILRKLDTMDAMRQRDRQERPR